MIKKIITHFRPHADELIAIMFLRNYKEAEEKFPGVRSAQIEFLSTGKLPEGKTYLDFPEAIFLGVGGGPFDEHETTSQDRAEGEVCATLVAKAIEIFNKPELKPILKIVTDEDLSAAREKDSLSVMIKFLHSCFKEDYERIYKWAEISYMIHVRKGSDFQNGNPFTLERTRALLKEENNPEYLFWEETINTALKYQDDEYKKALEEFDLSSLLWKQLGIDGKNINCAYVLSDNEEMGKAARTKGTQFLIQQNSKGNTFIFTDRRRGLDLTSIVILLRLAEQHYAGKNEVTDVEELSKTGMVGEDIRWYLFYTRDSIFNGSLTTKDILPTRIPKEKIVAIVKEGLQRKF